MITPDQVKFIKGIIEGIVPGTVVDEHCQRAISKINLTKESTPNKGDVLAELKSGDSASKT